MIHESTSLKYDLASEPLHIYASGRSGLGIGVKGVRVVVFGCRDSGFRVSGFRILNS